MNTHDLTVWKKAKETAEKMQQFADEMASIGEPKMSSALKQVSMGMLDALEACDANAFEKAWLYAHQSEYWLVLFLFAHRIGFDVGAVLIDEIAYVKHLLCALVRSRTQEGMQQ
jgi:hypothetical protein